MTLATAINLEKLNTFELYKHYAAMASSLELVTLESKEVLLAEMEACARLKSRKIDSIYHLITKHESNLEVGKKYKADVMTAMKHEQAEINALRGLLKEIRRRGYADGNKIEGHSYTYTVIPNPALTVEVSSDINDWSQDERDQFAMVEETIKTTHYKSANGKHIIQTDEKTTSKLIPNIDAIRTAYETNNPLPSGVRAKQDYQIRTKLNLRSEDNNEK